MNLGNWIAPRRDYIAWYGHTVNSLAQRPHSLDLSQRLILIHMVR